MARNKDTAVEEVDEVIEDDESEETEEARKVLTPSDLADLTGADPKAIRGWLRANFPRSKEMKGKSWDIPLVAWDAAVEYFTPSDDEDVEVDEELEVIEELSD
jgi:hypothetical protein